MKFTFVNLTAFIIFTGLFLSACKNESLTNDNLNSNQAAVANGENANPAKDDIAELGKL